VKIRSRAGKVAVLPIAGAETVFRIVFGISIEKSWHFSNSRVEKNS